MNGNALLTWHIMSSWNSLLGDVVTAHTFGKIQISEDLPVLRSRTGTPGLAGVTETYFPYGIMLHSPPVASGVLSSLLKYGLLAKIARLVHDSF